jgi:hypothetical protein
MASFKLNIASIQGCPDPSEVDQALAEFGLPDTEEFGVLHHNATPDAVFATIIRKSQTAVPKLDAENREVTAAPVERVTVYPFAVQPRTERLEIYAGSASGIEQIGVFLASGLALPVVVEPLELDIPAAITYLLENTKRFQLKSVRVSEYAHNAYMSGPYAPKFLDTEHGREFLEQYADFVAGAQVRFQMPAGRANATLTPKACFSYSCNEDTQAEVQSILRKLL